MKIMSVEQRIRFMKKMPRDFRRRLWKLIDKAPGSSMTWTAYKKREKEL